LATPQKGHEMMQDVIERLNILYNKLEAEGMYVSANTAGLAIDEIQRLRLLLKEKAGE
jgi:hypothetical protein